MGTVDFQPFGSPEQLAGAAAQDWLNQIHDLSSSEIFCVALAGGRIARTFFSAVTVEAKTRRLSLARVHFFWSDERCVPPEAAESNFRAAHELLLVPLAIAEDQIHRIEGERPPEQAASKAEVTARHLLPVSRAGQPVFDLVFLGMGEDGHVASLFPGEDQEAMASEAVFRSVTAVKPPPNRVTLGYPALAVARQVWVLASGAAKETALRQSMAPDGRTPLARVLKQRALTRIYSDLRL
jgi:6-phosphogluconolactonase